MSGATISTRAGARCNRERKYLCTDAIYRRSAATRHFCRLQGKCYNCVVGTAAHDNDDEGVYYALSRRSLFDTRTPRVVCTRVFRLSFIHAAQCTLCWKGNRKSYDTRSFRSSPRGGDFPKRRSARVVCFYRAASARDETNVVMTRRTLVVVVTAGHGISEILL